MFRTSASAAGNLHHQLFLDVDDEHGRLVRRHSRGVRHESLATGAGSWMVWLVAMEGKLLRACLAARGLCGESVGRVKRRREREIAE